MRTVITISDFHKKIFITLNVFPLGLSQHSVHIISLYLVT
jgi:hypothetical protein